MSRQRHQRPAPFADFINWTDYRWEPNTWRGAAAEPRPWGQHRPQRRRYSLLQVFLAGLAVVAGVRLMSSLRNRGHRPWIEKVVLGVLLLMVANFVSKRRQRTW
jgi:hypothetical protein